MVTKWDGRCGLPAGTEVEFRVNEDRGIGPAPLTSAARERLAAELETLRGLRAEVGPGLDLGHPTGDSADQADALERAMERQRVDQRIAEIVNLLERAETAEPTGDVVEVGTVVTVQFRGGSRQTLRVGDIAEADDRTTVLTPNSPLGRALLGRRAGDSVTYKAPDGETRARVVSVGTASDE